MTNNKRSPAYARNLFIKSATRLQNGDAVNARQGLLKAAKLLPDSAVVWYNLGLCHQHLAQHHKATGVYKKSLKINPKQVDAWVNLGISHKELAQSAQAQQATSEALKLDSNNPRALNLLGSLLAERGEYEAAKANLEKSLNSQPDNQDARINLANLELDHNNPDEALRIAEPLITLAPSDQQSRILKAKILLSQKEYAAAAPIVLELAAEYPQDEETLRLNLKYREAIRDHFGVISIAKNLLQKLPKDAVIRNSLGGAYFQLDSIDKAKQCYEKAVSLNPGHAEYQNNLGLAYSSLGDKQNAELHYRRSIELDPLHAEAYRNIATMKRFTSMDDADALQIKALWQAQGLDDFQTIKAAFTLGKVYDDCGLYDQAFKVYKTGNDLKFKESGIDLDIYFAHIDRVAAVFDNPPTTVSVTQNTPRPIFILGMPRSGTTLVEQILARHSRVKGCGELPCIERAITRLEKKSQPMRVYPNDFWAVKQAELERETREYLDWVGRLHDFEEPFFTDKMPFNFVHVWLIKAMFPAAPVVHCQRHPLDVITSNYFQLYGSDIGFVYNLETLARYYIRYHRLMIHWQNLFGPGIYTVRYEALVSDHETQARALIAAAGLAWEDNCLDQKRSNTAVRTASIWQVRQGIYTSSKERWRHYARHLGRVIEVLAEEGILSLEGEWLV